MAKPNIFKELENKTSREEVIQIIKSYAQDLLLDAAFEIITEHSHDDKYASNEQIDMLLAIVNQNDWGSIEEIEGVISKIVKLRGGSTLSHSSFIGAAREVTVDTDLWTLRVHNGISTGGFILAKASDVYTKSEIDQRLASIVSGGSLDLGAYATKMELRAKADLVHEHTEYAPTSHVHSEYAQSAHNHGALDITFGDGQTLLYKYENNLLANVNENAFVTMEVFNSHTHSEYAPLVHTHRDYSPMIHTHTDYSTKSHTHTMYVDTNAHNHAMATKADKIHSHTTDEVTYGDLNLTQYIEQYIEANIDHNHNNLYYTKEEVVALIKNYEKPNYKQSITVDNWQHYSIDDLYYCTITHGLKTNEVDLVCYSNGKKEYVDVDISTQSINELVIINDVAKNCDIIITTL